MRAHEFTIEAINPVNAVPNYRPHNPHGGIHIYRNAFPDGDLTISTHYGQRENERAVKYSDIVAMISDAVRAHSSKITAITDTDFVIKRRDSGMGIAIKKRERLDGSQMYNLATTYPTNFRVGYGQDVFFV